MPFGQVVNKSRGEVKAMKMNTKLTETAFVEAGGCEPGVAYSKPDVLEIWSFNQVDEGPAVNMGKVAVVKAEAQGEYPYFIVFGRELNPALVAAIIEVVNPEEK